MSYENQPSAQALNVDRLNWNRIPRGTAKAPCVRPLESSQCWELSPGMAPIHPRHLDQRRQLVPRDYASDPDSFGLTESLGFHVPAGGDPVSMRIAALQHDLVCRWNHNQRRPTAAQLGRWFGIKKQTLSLTTKGRRWAGETVLSALTAAVLRWPTAGSKTTT